MLITYLPDITLGTYDTVETRNRYCHYFLGRVDKVITVFDCTSDL